MVCPYILHTHVFYRTHQYFYFSATRVEQTQQMMTSNFRSVLVILNQLSGRMDGIENFILHNPTRPSAPGEEAVAMEQDHQMLQVTFAIPAQTKEDMERLDEHLNEFKKRRVLVSYL